MREPHHSERLPPEYFEAFGRLLVSFQALEEAVTLGIAHLSGSDRSDEVNFKYFLALSELPFRSRVKLLRNFLETTEPTHYLWQGCPAEEKRKKAIPEIISQMISFAKDCNSLEDQRNQMVHSVWEPGNEEPGAVAIRFKLRVQDKALKIAHEEVPRQKILDLVERMQATRNGLQNGTTLLTDFLVEKRANAL
jgi:hypothetical protein